MRPSALRRHLLATTIGITAAAYAILGFVLSSSRPPSSLPVPVMQALAVLPSVIAAVNASALVCLIAGWRAIKAGRIRAHRRLMVAAVALISLFLILYVTRVSLGGVKTFPGPQEIHRYVYLPALAVHITLSILSVPLVVSNMLIGLTHGVGDIARTSHPQVGRIAVTLWSVSLALGILVYLMLNVFY